MSECMWLASYKGKHMITVGRTHNDAANALINRVAGKTGEQPDASEVISRPFVSGGEDYEVISRDISGEYETVTYRRKLEPHEVEQRRKLVLD